MKMEIKKDLPDKNPKRGAGSVLAVAARGLSYPVRRLGILGGGQLARMMLYKTVRLGIRTVVLDPSPTAPAAFMADEFICGNLDDDRCLREVAAASDVTTYDIEHIAVEPLLALERAGSVIHPSPVVLETIQDKLNQKRVLQKAGIPVPAFVYPADPETYLKETAFPVVQKARFGGYDGRGVAVLKNSRDLRGCLSGECYFEEYINFERELAVMVVRDAHGRVLSYPVAEMVFDNRANICDTIIVPARIEANAAEEARSVAEKTVRTLSGVGIFGVELFLARDGRVLVNECAPRPHNSGHYTIEAAVTCQFEQHIRAVCGFPLGSTELKSPAVMMNLIGEPDARGEPLYAGYEQALGIPGLSIHLYGKREVRPFRKMGHVTIIDKTREGALEKAGQAKSLLKVRGTRAYE